MVQPLRASIRQLHWQQHQQNSAAAEVASASAAAAAAAAARAVRRRRRRHILFTSSAASVQSTFAVDCRSVNAWLPSLPNSLFLCPVRPSGRPLSGLARPYLLRRCVPVDRPPHRVPPLCHLLLSAITADRLREVANAVMASLFRGGHHALRSSFRIGH